MGLVTLIRAAYCFEVEQLSLVYQLFKVITLMPARELEPKYVGAYALFEISFAQLSVDLISPPPSATAFHLYPSLKTAVTSLLLIVLFFTL